MRSAPRLVIRDNYIDYFPKPGESSIIFFCWRDTHNRLNE